MTEMTDMEMQPPSLTIRPIRPADVPALNAIRSDPCVARSILSVTTETEEQTRRYFFEDGELKFTYIAQVETPQGPMVGGYVRLLLDANQRKRHIGKISIAVAPACQRRGVGGRLMDHIMALAENWFCLKKLSLTVLKANARAVELYRSKGFVTEGLLRLDIIVDGVPSDVYMMGYYLAPLDEGAERGEQNCPSVI